MMGRIINRRENSIIIKYEQPITLQSIIRSKVFLEIISGFFYEKILKDDTCSRKIQKKLSSPQIIIWLIAQANCIDLEKPKAAIGKLEEIAPELKEFTILLMIHWLKMEKHLFVYSSVEKPQQHLQEIQMHVNALITKIYINVLDYTGLNDDIMSRAMNLGFNSLIELTPQHMLTYKSSTIGNQNKILGLSKIHLSVPFMSNTYANTRSGLFIETNRNYFVNHIIDPKKFIAINLKVGLLDALIYINIEYIHLGIGLSLLFKLINPQSLQVSYKPKVVCVFGVKSNDFDGKYFYDMDNDTYIGTVTDLNKNDYLGYLKKMILTLHNLYMIRHHKLPIHGAMVNIRMFNDVERNVVIIGDSGVGKSETLEALRLVGQSLIRNMDIIFDDMGIFDLSLNGLLAFGTEIGAFIRIDDLDSGYAFNKIDNAVFLNTDRINARIILPVTDYETIIKGHKIDYVFYANNYLDEEKVIRIFKNPQEATQVFIEGVRFAKGTTSESGLVRSFFSNPFGPVQKEQETRIMINEQFNYFFDNRIVVGEILSKLALPGYETEGPRKVATELLKLLSEIDPN
jgi:hypothetical protein